MKIISEHEDSEHSPIDRDEERILHGALQFSHTRVREAMTPISDVIMFDKHQFLDDALREHINKEGYSRYPIYRDTRTNVIGILYAKDILTEEEHIAIKDAEDAFETEFLTAHPGEYLDTLLARMLKENLHMCIVNEKDSVCVGVITLEDIIEEIIQHEIEDEDDD
jgi:CBS domain containing-hemolysin-like protein